jgi:hypothetical protein
VLPVKLPAVRIAVPPNAETGEIGDMPAIERCHQEIEALVGQSLDLPKIDDPAILEYFVAEKDGEVIGAMYLEKSVRMCFVGVNPEATAAFRAETDFILASSKAAGVRFVHCEIWKDLPEAESISKQLNKSGFEPKPELLDHMCDLRV